MLDSRPQAGDDGLLNCLKEMTRKQIQQEEVSEEDLLTQDCLQLVQKEQKLLKVKHGATNQVKKGSSKPDTSAKRKKEGDPGKEALKI